MATRFYLPASGTAPLGSLAVDSSWGRSEDLVRRPCDVTKSNTSLTQKSYTWAASATNDWVWVQYQSKRMVAGYSWTTSDTVSMVIKVAEAVAQVDSHLAYCIRVVSADGSTVRGTIGVYQATSSEYPTSLASIATRIHNARTDGASNFSSSAGDRIIIEIGHYGVTPTADVVYHNYGDPSATQDYPLTAGETTDYCPWVELSRTVSFDNTSSKSAYMRGKDAAAPSHIDAYLNGSNVSYPANSHVDGYLRGKTETTPEHRDAFLRGLLIATPSHQDAYVRGSYSVSAHIDGYVKGRAETTPEHRDAYTRGKLAATPDHRDAYLFGVFRTSGQHSAFTMGGIVTSAHQDGFTRGQTTAVGHHDAFVHTESGIEEGSSFRDAFLLGIGDLLVPDGVVDTTGMWRNESGSQTNIHLSIDESYPNDSDYVVDLDPTNGNHIEFSLSNPAGTPGNGDVVLCIRFRDKTGSGNVNVDVELLQGAVAIVSMADIALPANQQVYYFQLTPEQKAAITDWTDLRVKITESL